ncbi:Regulator of Ty1 transposition protein [Paramyrothecium foliicola]|nr:Regulator of Ty1 transposition protein [Paramyrothecium foliicola]
MAAPVQPGLGGNIPTNDRRRSSSRVLSREFCQVPITALALYPAPSGLLYVLAAEDTQLTVYNAAAAEQPPIFRFPVFEEQPIHGLNVEGGRVLAWGANQVALFAADGLDRGTVPSLMARGQAPDWIYRGTLSPFDASRAVLVTAHNEAVSVWQDDVDETLLVMGEATSPSRPILSAAHIMWLSEDYLLVAGGSFFGEILVWKYQFSRQDGTLHEMLFILTGHEGSIFGMDISQPITQKDGSTVRFLASCSDDRTIRIWDITESSTDSQRLAVVRSRLNEIRETGFVSTSDTASSLENNDAPTPIAMAMGHISRIWGVRFAGQPAAQNTGAAVTVYSFGEDSTAQRWRLSLAPKASAPGEGSKSEKLAVAGDLTHEQTFALHQGKNLWASALQVAEDKITIVIGGADGKISLVEDEHAPESQQDPIQPARPTPFPSNKAVVVDIRDILANIPAPQPLEGRKQEIVNRYDFVSEDRILVTTSWGRLLSGTFENGLQWHELNASAGLVEDLRTCYVLKRLARRAAVIGTTSGNIYFCSETLELIHVAKVPGRVVDIFYLTPQAFIAQDVGGAAELLIYLFGSSVGHFFTLDLHTGSVQKQEKVQGLDSRFVAVSAAKVGEYLVLGSRHGWVSITKHMDGEYRPVLDVATPIRDAITSLTPVPAARTETKANYFVATSRDGKYRIYSIDDGSEGIQLHVRHESSPPFGPFIEGAWFTHDASPQLIMFGFRSKSFVIWNETTREEMATIECGGAHRTFVLFQSPSNIGTFRFAFTKASKLCIYNQERKRHRSFKPGLHGREIRALSFNGRYLATGAEDTSVRIWEYHNQGQATLRPLASMKAHVAGIQRIRWLGDDHLFSSGGNEEFFVWKVHRLEADYKGIGVVCENILTDKSEDADLRIMDFDLCRLDNSHSIIVTLAYSNTVLKRYRYESKGGFQLLAKGAYTGACLTQVRHLKNWDGSLDILTASTDGHLAIWKMQTEANDTGEFKLKAAVRLHQSSIKSLDMMADTGGYRVLTGGDDNALGIVFIAQLTEGLNTPIYRVTSQRIIRKAHSAAINGVLMITCPEAGLLAVSVSNDQRIKSWRLPASDQSVVGLLADEYSGVADPGDIEIIRQGKTIILAGVGLEAWKLGFSIAD